MERRVPGQLRRRDGSGGMGTLFLSLTAMKEEEETLIFCVISGAVGAAELRAHRGSKDQLYSGVSNLSYPHQGKGLYVKHRWKPIFGVSEHF